MTKNVYFADKVIYLVFCKVSKEEGWGHTLDGVGSSALYIFVNTELGALTSCFQSPEGEVIATHSPDGVLLEVLERYVNDSAISQYEDLTGKQVDSSYLSELFVGLIYKDPGDFEYENDVKTVLLEGEESFDDKTLKKVVNRYGVWMLSRGSMSVRFDERKKSLLVNDDERYLNLDGIFDDLFGNASQAALLIK